MDGNPPRTGLIGPPNAHELPPVARMLMLTTGKRISQVIYALTCLGVADHLATGPRTAAELAEATDANPDALRRLLRAAATVEVFREDTDGRFTLTPLAECLRSDVPYSVRDMVLFNGDELVWRPYGEILTGARTGRPVFENVFGRTFFDHIAAESRAADLFDQAMTRMTAATTRMLLDTYDFARFTGIADIGGGEGGFLGRVLQRTPGAKGLLFDRPQVAERARRNLQALGVADRATVMEGDFFTTLPSGYSAYVLKAVLHDWDDEHALAILRGIRAAIGADTTARLLIIEQVLAPPNQWDPARFLDIDMLLRYGGRERDAHDFRVLTEAAGFQPVNDPGFGGWKVLEYGPI
ncbi:methyltransferase [Actinoallomurus sp. NPDC052274]|uniref:methyltransferase n=1 Tax=Actinoallomurus sp. NPDC052274 TaxID=3155420 RepID=UPI00343FD438